MRSIRHEESQNGREVNIYIWEVIFWVPKKGAVFLVVGSFQKVPEDSGGVRESTSGFTMTQGLARAAGRRPGLIGLAPSPQKPMWLGKAKKEGVLVGIGLNLESKSSAP